MTGVFTDPLTQLRTCLPFPMRVPRPLVPGLIFIGLLTLDQNIEEGSPEDATMQDRNWHLRDRNWERNNRARLDVQGHGQTVRFTFKPCADSETLEAKLGSVIRHSARKDWLSCLLLPGGSSRTSSEGIDTYLGMSNPPQPDSQRVALALSISCRWTGDAPSRLSQMVAF